MLTPEDIRRLERQRGCPVPTCGKPKEQGAIFCNGCAGLLPLHMNAALVGHPEAAIRAAANYLREKARSYNEVRPRYLRLKHEKRGNER